jgi:hypothetical protein
MGIKVDLICWNIYTYSCHHQSPTKLQSNRHRLAQQVTIQISTNESIKTAFMPLTFVIATEMEEFPGGVQYHRKNEEMKKIMSGESKAIIFHMR